MDAADTRTSPSRLTLLRPLLAEDSSRAVSLDYPAWIVSNVSPMGDSALKAAAEDADDGRTALASVEEAVAHFARGRPVIVVDDAARENEGDLIMAADAATRGDVAFFLKHTSGVLCVALAGQRLDDLHLPLMVNRSEGRQGTAFTVSVDAAAATTGISAGDRALTVRLLADPMTTADDFTRPGHIFPLRAREGGVLKRAGHTEAGIDLAKMAGRAPAALLCEITTGDRAAMARLPELIRFGQGHHLPIVSIADLVAQRLRSERLVTRVASARIPTAHGEFECHGWRSDIDGVDHLALVLGEISPDEPVLVRVHSKCLTGDVFGSLACDCGAQLQLALAQIAREGRGVCVYLRGHEGRGIGIAHKLRAYQLQDRGRDTVDANLELGLPVDGREYGVGAQILLDLGVRRMRLLTNNPAKYVGLQGFGLEIVERVALETHPMTEDTPYLYAKRTRMGHLLQRG